MKAQQFMNDIDRRQETGEAHPAPADGAALPGYAEWDRSEWVGEGQEAPGASPPPAETEPRWTKWAWVGETQHDGDPSRGNAAAEMPEGERGLSGFRHNPGMGHWGGSRRRRGILPGTRALPARQ